MMELKLWNLRERKTEQKYQISTFNYNYANGVFYELVNYQVVVIYYSTYKILAQKYIYLCFTY